MTQSIITAQFPNIVLQDQVEFDIAVGETAPTIFTAHGSEQYNFDPFHGVQANLPLQSFQLIRLSTPQFVREAWGGAFILVFMVLGLFVATRVIGSSQPGNRGRWRQRRRPKEVPA